MPKSYILVEVTIPDLKAYQASGYMQKAEQAVAAHGGRFLVRGGDAELIEGAPPPNRLVILEFPTREAAAMFFASPEYAPALNLRQTLSTARSILLTEYTP